MHDGGVRVPEFTTTAPAPVACTWLARTVLAGSSGEGIVVVRRGQACPAAPLYTKYIKKTVELRMHVAFGKCICLQFKKREGGAEQTEDQKLLRNHDNGWVFCPRPVDQVSEDVRATAINAVKSLGLDFGAVDIVISKDDDLAYVLEVNTAPGIESPTLLAAYKAAFSEELQCLCM